MTALVFQIVSLPGDHRLVLCYLPGGDCPPWAGWLVVVDYGDPGLDHRRDHVAEAWGRLEARRGMRTTIKQDTEGVRL